MSNPAFEAAHAAADHLRSAVELDTSNADPHAYGQYVLALSNLAIAEALRDVADAIADSAAERQP